MGSPSCSRLHYLHHLRVGGLFLGKNVKSKLKFNRKDIVSVKVKKASPATAGQKGQESTKSKKKRKGATVMTKKKKSRRLKLQTGNYVIRSTGVFLELPEGQVDKICGCFRFLENRRVLGGNSVKVAVKFRDYDGEVKTTVVPRSDLLMSSRLIEHLVDCGWVVYDKGKTAVFLEEYFRKQPPKKSILMTLRPGWHGVDADDCDVYVTNQKVYRPSASTQRVVLAEEVEAGFASSGDLEDWNKYVANLCIGNWRLQFAVCFPLAGLILALSGLPNCGVHFFGVPKTGKTTLLKVAGSVIGDEAYVLSWNSTTNALEATAISRNDAILILDEIAQGDPKAVSEAIYNVINGRTKRRLGADIKLNAGSRFVGLVLSSGEDDLRTYLQSAGIDVKGGLLARLPSVPVPRKHGVFFKLHGHKNGGALASTLLKNISRYHGTLGPAFLTYVVKNQAKLKVSIPRKVAAEAERLLGLLDEIPDRGTYDIIAKSWALAAVAGEMAIAKGLLTWEKGDATKAVEKCFLAWAKHEQKSSANSDEGVLRHLQKFFQSQSAGKFAPLSEFERSTKPTLAGYIHKVDGNQVFLVYQAFFEADLCKQFGKDAAIRVLKKRKLLVLGARGTPMRQIHIPKAAQQGKKTKVSFYVIRKTILRKS